MLLRLQPEVLSCVLTKLQKKPEPMAKLRECPELRRRCRG
jgi:hypothetical protein